MPRRIGRVATVIGHNTSCMSCATKARPSASAAPCAADARTEPEGQEMASPQAAHHPRPVEPANRRLGLRRHTARQPSPGGAVARYRTAPGHRACCTTRTVAASMSTTTTSAPWRTITSNATWALWQLLGQSLRRINLQVLKGRNRPRSGSPCHSLRRRSLCSSRPSGRFH